MSEIGTAYLQIMPSMKGVGSSISKELGGIADAPSRSIGKTISSGVGGAFKKVAKVGAGAVALVGGAIVGLAATGGFSRALQIENAQAKLTGLGHDSASVSAIMDDALRSVKGTAYGLGDAATVAAGLVAAGVSQGDELTGVLTTVGDTAQISGRSFTDMGTIFGQVAAQGRLQGGQMLQLMQSGIPVLSFLAQHFGVTTEAAQDMVSKGQVGFADFAAAMKEGLGGAAQSAGTTFTGAMANARAALSRLGEKAMTPIMNGLRDIFNAAIPVIDSISEALAPAFEAFGALVSRAVPVIISGIRGIGAVIEGVAKNGLGALAPVGAKITAPFRAIPGEVGKIFGDLKARAASAISGLPAMLGNVGAAISGAFDGGAIQGLIDQLTQRFPLAGRIVQQFVDNVSQTLKVIGPIVQGVLQGVAGFAAMFASAFSGTGGISSLAALASTLSSLTSPLGVVKLIFSQFGDTLARIAQDVGPSIASVLTTLGGVLGTAIAAVLPGIQAAITAILPAIRQVIEMVGNIVSAILPVITAALTTLGPVIEQIATVVGQLLAAVAPIVAQLVSTVVPVITNIATALANLATAVLPIVASAISIIVSAIQVALPVITTVASVIASVIGVIITIIGNVISVIVNVVAAVLSAVGVVTTAVSSIASFLAAIFAGIAGTVGGVISTVVSVVTGGFNLVVNVISGAVSAITSLITGLFGAVGSVFRSIVSTVTSAGSAAFSAISGAFRSIVSAVSGAIGDVLSAVGSLPGRILGFFANAGSLLVNAGKSIIDGLVKGIQNAIGGAVKAVGGVVDKIRSLFPFSPAKTGPFSGRGYTTYSGRALMGDWAKSMAAAAPLATEAARSAMSAVRDALDDVPAGLSASLSVTGDVAAAPAPRAGLGGGSTINVTIAPRDLRDVRDAEDFTARVFGLALQTL